MLSGLTVTDRQSAFRLVGVVGRLRDIEDTRGCRKTMFSAQARGASPIITMNVRNCLVMPIFFQRKFAFRVE